MASFIWLLWLHFLGSSSQLQLSLLQLRKSATPTPYAKSTARSFCLLNRQPGQRQQQQPQLTFPNKKWLRRPSAAAKARRHPPWAKKKKIAKKKHTHTGSVLHGPSQKKLGYINSLSGELALSLGQAFHWARTLRQVHGILWRERMRHPESRRARPLRVLFGRADASVSN